MVQSRHREDAVRSCCLPLDAVFYLWFEAFPLVFSGIYHFNEGLSGLPFLGFLVSGIITVRGHPCFSVTANAPCSMLSTVYT